jgi:hypothetical protein
MAQAQLVYIGTDDGLITLSQPGKSTVWRRVGHTLGGQAVRRIAAQDAMYLVVATDQHIQHSQNGGLSWEPAPTMAPPAPTTQLTLPGEPPALLAAHTNADGRSMLVYSDDQGVTWHTPPVTTPDGTPATLYGMVTVIAPVAYHRDYTWAGTDAGQLLYTGNRGHSWLLIDEGFAPIHSVASARIL